MVFAPSLMGGPDGRHLICSTNRTRPPAEAALFTKLQFDRHVSETRANQESRQVAAITSGKRMRRICCRRSDVLLFVRHRTCPTLCVFLPSCVDATARPILREDPVATSAARGPGARPRSVFQTARTVRLR
jgi:hypothetical protein